MEGPEKTVDGSLICEELSVMAFVAGVLLCRSERCLGCRIPYFRHLRRWEERIFLSIFLTYFA